MTEQYTLNAAITGTAKTIDVQFNTASDAISFQFIYNGLNANTVLMPQISLNNGANYDDLEIGQITLASGSGSEGITINDLRSNMAIRWRILASDATAGTITSVYVGKGK